MNPLAGRHDPHGSRPAQHGATPAYAAAVLTWGAADAYTQHASQTTSAGVRVEPGHVVVARGSEHEAVLSEATLELGKAPLKQGPLRYAHPAVERDLVAFMHRSWRSFFVLSCFFLLEVSRCVILRNEGRSFRLFALIPAVALCIMLGVLLTDTVTQRLQQGALARFALPPATRTRLHEQLLAIVVACWVIGCVAEDPSEGRIVFCPGTPVDAELTPLPTAERLAFAARHGHCVADSLADKSMLVVSAILLTGRLCGFGAWVMLLCVAIVLGVTCAPVGVAVGVTPSYYNVCRIRGACVHNVSCNDEAGHSSTGRTS